MKQRNPLKPSDYLVFIQFTDIVMNWNVLAFRSKRERPENPLKPSYCLVLIRFTDTLINQNMQKTEFTEIF